MRPGRIGTQLIEQRANRVDDINVHFLGCAADVVSLAEAPALQDCPDRPAVILDKEPVADIFPLAVDRQRFALDRVTDDQRNQLFRELVGPVVVRTVRRHHGHLVRVERGADQKVARRLARRIRTVRRVGRKLGKRRVARLQSPVNLVGRNVEKVELCLLLSFQLFPVATHRIQQALGAQHVGRDERLRRVDRAVDVRLSGKVKHRVNLVLPQQLGYEGGIPDIAFDKYVPRVPIEIGQRTAVARVRQQIKIDQFGNFPVSALQRQTDEISADKSGAAGNEEVHDLSDVWRVTSYDLNRLVGPAGPAGRCYSGCSATFSVASFASRLWRASVMIATVSARLESMSSFSLNGMSAICSRCEISAPSEVQ